MGEKHTRLGLRLLKYDKKGEGNSRNKAEAETLTLKKGIQKQRMEKHQRSYIFFWVIKPPAKHTGNRVDPPHPYLVMSCHVVFV
jgi:hypothetical protein